MPIKKYKPEQIVTLLRQIEVEIANGKTTPQACREAQITAQNYKFTGYERDQETGLDYAMFRYYNPRLGRFMSPDPLGGDIGDPQSLNRYAYVLNNPLIFTDPLGLYCWGDKYGGQHCNVWPKADPPEIHLTDVPGICATVYKNGFRISSSNGCAPNPPSDKGGHEGGGGPTIGPASHQPITPCRIIDPLFPSIEFTVKIGPEVQVGPLKLGGSIYKNMMSGASGAKLEASAGLAGVQADNPTPMGGSLGGTTEGIQTSVSLLGFVYNFTTSSLEFSPSKNFTLGLQALVGGEVSFNSDTFKQLGEANAACRAQGGS